MSVRVNLPRHKLTVLGLSVSFLAYPVILSPSPAAANGACTVLGTVESEYLQGTEGDDIICAGDGQDVVDGLGGADVILGEGGADIFAGGDGNDTLRGGEGDDAIQEIPAATRWKAVSAWMNWMAELEQIPSRATRITTPSPGVQTGTRFGVASALT